MFTLQRSRMAKTRYYIWTSDTRMIRCIITRLADGVLVNWLDGTRHHFFNSTDTARDHIAARIKTDIIHNWELMV